MRTLLPSLRAFAILGLLAAVTMGQTAKKDDKAKGERSEIQITAESSEGDFNNRLVTFLGNVKVSDERFLLLADKINVHLNEENRPKLIEAIGHVVINEVGTQRKATAGKAVFDVATDQVVLTDNPALENGPGMGVNKAETIIYDRKHGKYKMLGGISIGVETERGKSPTDILTPGGGKKNDDKKEDQK
jgi:lipopolysaccharide transport protein LptA